MKVGISVYCVVCGSMKAPVGRSTPIGRSYCGWDCPGYFVSPHPGSLWPGETENDFGYLVQDAGTTEVQ